MRKWKQCKPPWERAIIKSGTRSIIRNNIIKSQGENLAWVSDKNFLKMRFVTVWKGLQSRVVQAL